MVQAAQLARVPIEVCGEAASDPIGSPLLIGAGVDEISVGAARVGTVRQWVRSLSFAELSDLEVQGPPAGHPGPGRAAGRAASPADFRSSSEPMQMARFWSARSASAPLAASRSVDPRLAPSASTASRLFASASRSSAATVISASNCIAARTKLAAGRACRSTSAGSSTTSQSLLTLRVPSAASMTPAIGLPADDATAAASAPSTNGASMSRT